MLPTRRQALIGAGAALVGTVGLGTNVFAQGDSPLLFVEVSKKGEYVTIKNVSGGDFDVSEYGVNFEIGQSTDQIRWFSEGTWSQESTTLTADETLKIATGAKEVPDADVTFDYARSEIRNDGSDVIGIVNADSEIVIRSDNDSDHVSDDGGETETPEETATEEPTETAETTEQPTTEEPATEEPAGEEPADEKTTEPPTEGESDDSGSDSGNDNSDDGGDGTEDGAGTGEEPDDGETDPGC